MLRQANERVSERPSEKSNPLHFVLVTIVLFHFAEWRIWTESKTSIILKGRILNRSFLKKSKWKMYAFCKSHLRIIEPIVLDTESHFNQIHLIKIELSVMMRMWVFIPVESNKIADSMFNAKHEDRNAGLTMH